MSTVESTSGAFDRGLREARDTFIHYRSTAGWLLCACVVMVAAFACTTIEVRDSVFDVSGLRILFAALLSVAATNILAAFGVRSSKCHVVSWVAVSSGILVLLWLT